MAKTKKQTATTADLFLVDAAPDAVPLFVVTERSYQRWLEAQDSATRGWVETQRYQPKPGRSLVLPGKGGAPAGAVVGAADSATLWNFAALTFGLPTATYRVELPRGADAGLATTVALGWAYGGYRFTRYKKAPEGEGGAVLVWPQKADRAYVTRATRAARVMRNRVNTPAGDLGPEDLGEAALEVARAANAEARVVMGQELLQNYPMVHAVGRAGRQEPRLVDIRWGTSGPRVTLIGKGVTFDTGGLDIKPADAMLLMKKDMAGSAVCIALLQMLAEANFDIRLRVLLPLVENAIASDAFHPGDVLPSRKGLSVEIGNTDAEGRLILGDALADADDEKPDLLIDFSTLTGAARVALGPELPAMYSNDDATAADLQQIGMAEADPMWRLPLWPGYNDMLDSKLADLNNAPGSGMGGSITAALFLQRFVTQSKRWVHLDLYGWNNRHRPGRPEGAEAQTLRAVYRLIERRYGKKK